MTVIRIWEADDFLLPILTAILHLLTDLFPKSQTTHL